MLEDVTLEVSEAIELVNETLDQAFAFMLVEGEVASFKVNQNKFVFFDIKDDSGTLGCFMMLFNLKFPLADGMRVKVLAQPKLTNWGKFSLTVREVMPVGEGALKKSFDILKKKLEAEGLFEAGRKRSLPKIPKRIGIVSSSGAAGYTDFIKILNNRWGGLELVLADVPVQGISAPPEIIGAINFLNELPEPLDVIAIIRGGGSADDLSAFNHEDLVRAVALSRTPTIIGVGHEVDISLSDLAADVRAATPSNAAEILVPDKAQVLESASRVVGTAQNGAIAAIRVFEQDIVSVKESIEKSLDTFFIRYSDTLRSINRTLYQLNPQAVLKRGYGLVRKDRALITSTEDVIIGDEITIEIKDGELGANILYAKQNK